MPTKVFIIRDSKANAYLTPFHATNEQVAIRMVSSVLTDHEHLFYNYPEDYQLFILGEFDEISGKFTSLDAPEHLVNIIDLANASDHENVGA